MLFNLLVAHIIEQLSYRDIGLKLNGEYLGLLAFADDIALLADGYKQAQETLNALSQILNRL